LKKGFWSVGLCFPAFLTDRRRDKETRPRQSRTDMARKPKKAPTTMNTVPSGRLDCCIKGALEVSGTTGVTIDTPPDKVGRPVAPTSVLVGRDAVIETTLSVEVAPDELAPVVPDPVVSDFEVVAAADAAEASEAAALDRLGRPVSAAAVAEAAIKGIAKKDAARAVANNGVLRANFMMSEVEVPLCTPTL